MPKSLLLVVASLGLAALTACGGNVCKASDEVCECAESGECEITCKGGGCNFLNNTAGDAHFYCNGGGCTVTNDGQGSAYVHCDDGDCTITQTGQGETVTDCEGGGCTTECGGQGGCSYTNCADCACSEADQGTCE